MTFLELCDPAQLYYFNRHVILRQKKQLVPRSHAKESPRIIILTIFNADSRIQCELVQGVPEKVSFKIYL